MYMIQHSSTQRKAREAPHNDRVAHTAMTLIFNLPGYILQESVLSFVDVYSLVRFSGCSKQCSKTVFDDSPSIWRDIQFCNGVHPCEINDNQLRSFLTKVKAQRYTRSLSLIGCPNITGRGLGPLHRSKVLEDIDLRVIGTLPMKGVQNEQYGPSCLDERYVSAVLTSILVEMRESCRDIMVLRRIAIRTQPLPIDMSSHMADIYTQRDQFWSRWKSSSCLKCKVVQSDECSQRSQYCAAPHCENVWWCPTCRSDSLPYEKCTMCRSDYCKQCTPQLMKCSVCKHSYCKLCALPPSCSECRVPKCQWCSNLTKCYACNKECCACHGFENCAKCDQIFCSECTDDELIFCVVCNLHYCSQECHSKVHS